MYTEHQQQFNESLSRWIANQGFWFQMRHSIGASGYRGNFTFHLVSLSIRVLMALFVLAIIGWVYLLKRTDSQTFREQFRESVSNSLGATEIAMRGIKRSRSTLEVSRIAGEGEPDTFFEFLEIRNFRCKMGLLDGLVGKWDLGLITIDRLEGQIRSGTDNPEQASGLKNVIFQQSETVNFDNIDVTRASLTWGYSDGTRGRIEESTLKIRRFGDGWRVTLHGGRFSQNWLRNMDIEELAIVLSAEGVLFEQAKFRVGTGQVDFSGLMIAAGDRPQADGVVSLIDVRLDQIIPPIARNYIEGSINTKLAISGSTNSADGLQYDGVVSVTEANPISLRDNIHVLRALSVVDINNNYRRLNFDAGSFRFTTGGGRLQIRNINLQAGELASMAGGFSARQPSNDELVVMLTRGRERSTGSGTFMFDGDSDDGSSLNLDDMERQFTLRQAANAARRAQERDAQPEEFQLFDRLELSYEARYNAEQQAARLSRMLVYEGEAIVYLLPHAFERAETMSRDHPVDPEINRIPVRIPIQGPLHELTFEQAAAIYERGRR